MIITLTPQHSPPMVEISVADMDPPPDRMQITRIVDGDEWPVRVSGQIIAGSGAQAEDHEAPTGVIIYYRVETFDSNGALLESGQESTGPLYDAPESWVWLSDPLDNTSARLVRMTSETDTQRSYPIPLDISYPRSSKYGTAAYSHAAYGRRQAGPGKWQIHAAAGEEFDIVVRLLAGSILIRPQQWHRLGPSIYGVADQMTADVVGRKPEPWPDHGDHPNHFAVISFELTPTRGPAVSVLVPRRTWRDLLNEVASWREVSERYASWREVLRGQ